MTALHPLTDLLLEKRGVVSAEDKERFLVPDYGRDVKDPFGILNMDKAVDRIFRAFRGGERIVIYGDYDCDGIPGSVVLHDLFEKIGVAEFRNYIPHRHLEGYGLNKDAIAGFAKDGVDLIITVDCGITDVDEVAMAQSLGMDVIVTDHHLPGPMLPPAFAVINSKQEGDAYHDDMLCGAGVAWKLAQAIIARGRADGKMDDIPLGWEKWLLDMAGLSTIADMVPLRNENRALAHFGLKVLRKSPRPGLIALLRSSGLDQRFLTEEDIGFTIGPRINAASRMDVPMRAFELLATNDPSVAMARAEHLTTLNEERKGEVARMVKEAKRLIDERESRPVIVVGSPKWRVGVAGIVATQLVEAYDRPAFVWGREGGEVIKGSCRSDGRVNIVELMRAVKDGIFIDRGGHEFSGGFSVHGEAIHFLESSLIAALGGVPQKEKVDDGSSFDAELGIDDLGQETFSAIDALAPFGEGNPKPVFRFESAMLSRVEQFGKGREHLRLALRGTRGSEVSAIGFFKHPGSFAGADIAAGARVDLYGHYERSHFRGRTELRLRIVDIR